MQKRAFKLFVPVGLLACGALIAASTLVNADPRGQDGSRQADPVTEPGAGPSLETLRDMRLNGLADDAAIAVDKRPLTVPEILHNIESKAPGVLNDQDIRMLRQQLGIQRSAQGGPLFDLPGQDAANDDIPPTEIQCHILDPNAQVTDRVQVAFFKDSHYWFYYSGGVLANQVTFLAFPLFAGSPLTAINHGFELSPPSGTAITSPFGIPFWANELTCGPWAVVCKNDIGQTDLYMFNVNCDEEVENCPGDGDCCADNGTPGCENAECCASVCDADAFCCETSWDQLCADQAATNPLCGCTETGCGAAEAGDCCVKGGNGTPYCDNLECCVAVCEFDPFCCETTWDGICAGEALDKFNDLCQCD